MTRGETKSKCLVPRLRFPEFRDEGEWESYRLGTITERITEKVGSKPLTTLSITAGVGFVSQTEKFSRDISGKQYENYILLKKGEFSYNKGNSMKFPQGCIYKLREYKQAAVPNAFICFRFYKDYVADFYRGYFDNNFHGKQLSKFITSGARSDGLLNVSPDHFFSIVLPTPVDKKEQQKIADCLSSLDELITAESQKLESYKTHKKGLMQKLFPAAGETAPELRFPEFRDEGEWRKSTLGDKEISAFVKEKMQIKQVTLSNYISTENLLNDYEGVKFASKLPQSGTCTRFKKGDILISNIRPYLKKVWAAKWSGGSSNDVIVIRAKLKIEKDFLSLLLRNDDFITYVMKGAKGVKMPRGDLSLMKEYTVAFPKLKEQQRISNCLSSLDELITAQGQKIEALKAHKKGLMQGLFPSADEGGL